MRQPRPFGTFDAVVLFTFGVAAIAATFCWDLWFLQLEAASRRQPIVVRPAVARRPAWVWSLQDPFERLGGDLRVFLVVATAGIGIAPLRRPGLLRARGWPAPGIAAGAVGGLAAAYCIALVGVWRLVGQPVGPRGYFLTIFQVAGGGVAGVPAAVLACWTVLAIARRWRPRPGDWDDRLGCLFGWGWLLLMGCEIVGPAIWP